MSRRWLLSLLCLSVLFVSLAPLTRARGELKVNEARTKLSLEPALLLLAVENSTGEALKAKVDLELLDTQDRHISEATSVQTIPTGNQSLTLSLPLSFSKLERNAQRGFLWHRLHYRLCREGGPEVLAEGIVSLSEITPDLFEIRVAPGELVREGTRYRTRVLASHPVTHKAAANVVVDGELTLEDDNDKSVKLHNAKTTDSDGYAVLDFVIPNRFPQFPHTLRPSGGELRVTGSRNGFVAEAQGDIPVDQFPKIFITTDKPLYQPGQIMHLRALVFTPSNRALANQNIFITVSDPERTTVSRTVVKTSRFGIVNTDWPIPENVRLGDYRIFIGVEGNAEYDGVEYGVRISRYDLPNFSVSVQTDRAYYLPGQNADVRVRADYLFGQPVKRGHVRVIRETEREWNYREQKWDVEEGEKYEGETDANGSFLARLDLADDLDKIRDRSWSRYEDLHYAAYFTDATTQRTEQRRFDVRISKEAIHVYLVSDYSRNQALPLRFYVVTSYADGSPVRCKVNIELSKASVDSRGQKRTIATKQLGTVRTNRYGVAKLSGVRLPREFENGPELNVKFSAIDSSGRTGTDDKDLGDDDELTRVETAKVIHRAGEPILATITSSLSDKFVTVDLYREATIIRSERVRLSNGRGSVTFPYTADFKDRISIVAYPDFPDDNHTSQIQTILYPRNNELQVKARPTQTTYRPGENAHVNLNVRTPQGGGAESALGVIVLDKAIEERYRTTQEFGGTSPNYEYSLQQYLGLNEQLGGVSLRDLQRLENAVVISPDLDLVAEVLLNQSRGYSPRFFGGDQYDTEQPRVFGEWFREQLAPTKYALERRYLTKMQYPSDEAELRSLLLDYKIDFNRVLDPWGVQLRPVFSVDGPSDILTLITAGADKRFGTDDDFSVERFGWRYFLPLGTTIDRAIRQHHERTRGFIRDFATLREELSKARVALDQLRDRWGQPYRFEFSIKESNYVLEISSSGPDKVFAEDKSYTTDDFVIWLSTLDYFSDTRTSIENTLEKNLKSTKKFPQTDQELHDVLLKSENPPDTLRDPWGRPYYATYKTQSLYADRADLESRGRVGETPATRVTITPVTQVVASITLRSMGPDGSAGTIDDFTVAFFRGVLSEQARGDSAPRMSASQIIMSGSNGAIAGTVMDVNMARIAGAKVTAILGVQDKRFESLSDEEGTFTIGNLPPGVYEIRFEAPGFAKSIITNVMVSVSSVTNVNATLQVAAAVETVMISGGASAVEQLSQSSVSASRTINDSRFRIITKSGGSPITTPHLREYFPETLVWQPSLETDKQGRASINFKLADNITTWKLAVFGSTEDGRIGTTETEIKSFQPFFVEHDPPRVLTEGDEISLPVVVRNYLQQRQRVDLELKPENWFSLRGPAHKGTSVAAGDASRETFDIRATSSIKDGKQRITATAADGNDAIEKPVTVHPDGQESSVTDSDILGSSASLQLFVPENMIPNSSQAELKIYPNLMSHVIESVEAIMSRPYGCGEQVISSSYPSLLLLRHRKLSGQESPLGLRAERYLSLGYSRLLNYRDESGGFTYWGRGKPDVALTAYALRFLTDAKELISVDEEVIKDAQQWLIKQQQAGGTWVQDYWNDKEAIHRTAILTAYVARVLTATGDSEGKAAALTRALDFVGREAATIDEPYLLASYALAVLNVQDTTHAKPIIEKLATLAHREGSSTYWVLETNTPFYGWGMAGRVETTALVVQALTKFCSSPAAKCDSDPRLVTGGLLFLLKQKDRYGVWYSTQATINVLDALLSMLTTQLQGNSETQAATEVVVNEQLVERIKLPVANHLVGPTTVNFSKVLHTGKNTIRIKRAEGSPYASVQALASFYEPWAGSTSNTETRANDLRLQAKCDKTDGKVGDEFTCHVEAERIAFRGYGMMLAEIGVPPGADVDRNSLETAMQGSGWVINQYDILPDRVVVYLWPYAGGAKFDFKFRPRFGLNAKSAASVLYDYYNPEARAVVPPATFRVKEE